MNQVESKVRTARLRLILGIFGRSLSVALFAGLIVATVAIAVPGLRNVSVDFAFWTQAWLLGSVGVSVLAAAIYTWRKTPSVESVAAEVDRRFGLRERLSSSMRLDQRNRETDFGLALQEDADRRANQLAIADKFSLRPDKIGWLPLAIVPVLTLVLLLVDPITPDDANPVAAADSVQIKQVKAVAKQLKKRIEQQKRKADSQGLKESQDLFEKMETELDKLTQKKDLSQKEALIKLNDLKSQLEERKKELGSSDEMRKALSKVSGGLQSGEGDKVAKAIQKGEFGKAEEIVKQLSKKLKDGKLSKSEKKELKKQVQKMADALKKATEQHEKKKQELKDQIKKAKQEGRGADASKLQQKLNQMRGKDSQMQKMGKMAQSMQQAADAMQNGDAKQAADAMEQLSDELGEMSQEMSELEDLESAMQELSQSKSQMRCKQCQGGGCKQCQGGGFSDKQGEGNGLGRGPGQGDRPESEDDTNTYETQVRGKVGKGKAVITGFADGPNRKGVTRESIQAAIESQISEESNPTENQNLPRAEREHAQQYFDRLRKGL